MTKSHSGFAIVSNLRSLETLSTEDYRRSAIQTPSLKHQELKTKYRLAPYSKLDLSTLGTYLKGTSRTAASRKRVLEELLDLIEEDSQPNWQTQAQDVSDFSTTPGSESEESDVSYLGYWSDEENPGGEGPPLVPPTPGPKAPEYPPHFLFLTLQ
ncbi:ORF3 [Seal anellovirus 6]|uniref:ORF3 n=1 Tax=Seal anellovirus 6 TaxID=1566012 RepID=A0A0A7TVX2_9VIRU|nr:ORF3 [Seal anellovirus 6]